MGKLRVPEHVTRVVIDGITNVINGTREVLITAEDASRIVPAQFQPKLLRADLGTGDVTVRLSPIMTEIGIDGTDYVADENGDVVLPAREATYLLGSHGWAPFVHASGS